VTEKPSRRDRQRTETRERILDTARHHLAQDGAAGLSLRAIARDLDVGVSSLYRYMTSRDELITELLVESFDAQADAVDAAVARHRDPVVAIRAALDAYRAWSREHPTEFALAYGTPVPGYAAPGDRTIAAAVRVGSTMIGLLAAARDAGRLDPAPTLARDGVLSVRERDGMTSLVRRRDYDVDPALMSLCADLLVAIHGFVVMEVFGQLRPVAPTPDRAFRRTVDEALRRTGLS
jgi:AcrR family transcriptional regulator